MRGLYIKSNSKGYTLVELVAVISIISILALIALPGLTGYASVAKKQADKQTVALYARAIAIAMASNDIPYATDKLTLTGSSGELDKYESVMVALMGSPDYRKLIKANRAEFEINANGSIEYTIMWLGGLISETEIFEPVEAVEPPDISTYMLNVTSGTGGSAEGSGVYDEGTEVIVRATASEGYQFKNWTGSVADSTSAFTTFIIPASNSTITANFELIPLPSAPSIAFTNNGNKNTVRATGLSGATIHLYLNGNKIESKVISTNQTSVTFNSSNSGSYKATQSINNGAASLFSNTIIK
ncbi:MAG: prepilin-type N-terminal cleavage/methylation domain-containing protein [Eubacteriales bacterium]|nr:prepilin-type N-terminal cleavage/methylation domain-containing protein [Eubacteriales bacterium]